MSEFGKAALAVVAAFFVLAGTALAQDEQPVPLSPQPADGDLKPGIAVEYYYGFRGRHTNAAWALVDATNGDPGDPIPMLDYNVGNEPMLTNTRNKFLVAHMKGAMHFKEPGTYKFTALTNDGFELNIGGAFILEDPDVHFDRWSDIVSVEIPEAGWYDLEMLYFNRKGTETLELYWRPPWDTSEGDMQFVPAEVFAHLPGGQPS